jgi:hypothetical protein
MLMEKLARIARRDRGGVFSNQGRNISVMPGLDPGIHLSSQECLFEVDGLPGQARQ